MIRNNTVVRHLVISCVAATASLSFSFALAQSTAQPKFRAGDYIVKMKTVSQDGASQNQKSQNNFEASSKGQRIVSALGKTVLVTNQMPDTAMMGIYSLDKNKIAYLKSHPDIEFVEPNYILSSAPTEVSGMAVPPQGTDTYSQSYAATQVTSSWSIAKAYNHATAKTIVAVIDTGLDSTHGVFADSNSIWTNSLELNGAVGVDDDGNGYVDDIHGWNFNGRNANMNDDNEHGTHVAGIVLGVGEDINVTPIRESRIKIMPLKFLDSTGSGTTTDAISAITYAVRNGAKVINNSWGGPSYSRALHEAYTYAYNNNVVIVTAAGNNAQNIDTYPVYPGALDTPSNITVSSTNDSDNLSSFSNYSVAGLSHLSAPGSSILSPVPAKGLTCSYPGCYKYMSGTSMAAPFVAGLAALVIREAPQLSAYQIKGLILGAVDTKSNLINKVQTSGRANALKSVQAGINGFATAYWSPAYSPEYKVETRSVASSEGSSGGGCGMVQILESTTASGGGLADLINIFSVLVMVLIPALFSLKLRAKKPDYVRKHSRFNLEKVMQIKMNDQVIDLISNSVSLGGFSFSKDVAIDKGQKIKVKIDNTEVDAEVVWSRENNSYGVKFSSITEALKTEIESWTCGMVPTT